MSFTPLHHGRDIVIFWFVTFILIFLDLLCAYAHVSNNGWWKMVFTPLRTSHGFVRILVQGKE